MSTGTWSVLESEPCSKPRTLAVDPPWRVSGPWGAMWIPRATRSRCNKEHDPICKPKAGQTVGEFKGQRSAKP